MILKNMKHGDVRPGDIILVWAVDPIYGERPSYDLIVSVNITGEFVYHWRLDLSTMKLRSSQSSYLHAELVPYVLRVKP